MNNPIFKNATIIMIVSIFIFAGCKDSTVEPVNNEPVTDKEAMIQIMDEDSLLSTFIPNYNEEDVMEFLPKTTTTIYPVRVGQKVRLINRNVDVQINGDTAYVSVTNTFEGVLLILARYDSTSNQPDTLIKKMFTSNVKRNLIFLKIRNTNRPRLNWRIMAVSLPEGGTLDNVNIDIIKLTFALPDGNLIIENPNEYYLSRMDNYGNPVPLLSRNDSVLVKAEVYSLYENDDFVTLTFGADRFGAHRHKIKFDLVSSVPEGNGYLKVYQQYLKTRQWPGFYHAIINVFPERVIFDDGAPVENNMWGIAYKVRF